MCVITSTAAAAAVTIATALISTATGIQSAVSKNKVAKFQAEQNIKQAKIAERNAEYERQEGIEDARHRKLKSIQNMESIRTKLAAGNIATTSDTTLFLLDDEETEGEMDALKLIETSERKSDSYLNSAQNLYLNSRLTKYNQKQSLINNQLSNANSLGGKFINLANKSI